MLRLRDLFKNPLTEWAFWLAKKAALERRNPGLSLGYMAKAFGCRFGQGNTVRDRTLLVDCALGDYCYVSNDCFISNASFGKFCSVGPFTRAGLGLHPSDTFVSTHPAFYSRAGQAGIVFADREHFVEKKPIEVGHDVWIGANVLLKDGIRIGDGAVVAGGAVVAADVPPYAIVGGVPAKLLRYRFSEERIRELSAFKWWDKDPAWLKKNHLLFLDIEKLFGEPALRDTPPSN